MKLASTRIARRMGVFLVSLLPSTATFGQPATAADPEIKTHRSAYCIVHTDLADGEAQALVARLDGAIDIVSGYWGRRPKGMIECYVAQDVSKWPQAKLPHPLASLVIAKIGGVTDHQLKSGRDADRKAVVYASATRGVAEHEIVHAYCLQTFGEMGPLWYSEGLAEIACHGVGPQAGVAIPDAEIEFLHDSDFRSIEQVVNGGQFTSEISDSLQLIMKRSAAEPASDIAHERWTAQDAELVVTARQTYRWSWALCYLLCHNDNYSKRFQALGQGYLSRRGESFDDAFGAVHQQLEFEYSFFVQRVERGYRVDLCRWDWSKPFRPLNARRKQSVRVLADRGYQPSGIAVTSGTRYRYRANGAWSCGDEREATGANGRRTGTGRLVGVVMNGFRLSEPFDLGDSGVFTANTDGHLYVRCQDAWNELADNRGSLTVRFELD